MFSKYSVKSIISVYCAPAADAPMRIISKRIRNNHLFFFGCEEGVLSGRGGGVGNSTSTASGRELGGAPRGGSGGGTGTSSS